jgi:PPOX class probable F420-dependent enzyme
MAGEAELLELFAATREGVLAVVRRDGYPHTSNVLYLWDAGERTARVTTQGDRVKGRALLREPKAALHVAGAHFWSFASAECDVETSGVTAEPGDTAGRELLALHTELIGDQGEEDAFFAQMIEQQRMVLTLKLRSVHGVALAEPPG